MEEALSVYSNRDSANVNGIQLSLTDSGVLSKPFSSVVQELKDVITELRTQTEDFNYLSPSEAVQDATFENLKKYSSLLNAAKQYTASNVNGEEIISVDKEPDLFYKTIGIAKDEEVRLTTVIANDLKRRRSKAEGIDVSHIELEMAHIHNVRVNYDYLTDLIARMANAVHEKNIETAEKLEEEIHRELEKAENEQDRIKFRDFVRKIIKGEFKFNKYPAPNNREEVIEALNESQEQTVNSKIDDFIARWGIGENTTNLELTQMINKHRVGSREDLNKQNELNKIMNRNQTNYQIFKEWKSLISTGTQDNLNAQKVKNFIIPFPSFPEQTAIGSFFQDLDNLITLHQRKLEVLKEQKKTYLKLLFPTKGKTKPALRFTGFEDGWKEVKLGDLILRGGSGGTPKSTVAKYYGGDIPFLSITDISNSGKYLKKTEKTITNEGLQNSSAWVVPEGAISLAMYASVGKLAILRIDCATSQAFYNMVFEDDIVRNFVYITLEKANIYNEWGRLISTGTQANLNAEKVKNFSFLHPSKPEQEAIGSFFQYLDKAIAKQEEKVNQLKESKRTFLKKMFI